MTYKQRLIGFGSCLGLALLFCHLSMLFLPSLAVIPAGFAVPYTFGNILAVCSTGFLVGPLRQLKMMLNPTRIIASIIYVLALALTLVAAFVLDSKFLVLVAVIVQFCAIIWYCLSYIPFARQIAKTMFNSCTSSV